MGIERKFSSFYSHRLIRKGLESSFHRWRIYICDESCHSFSSLQSTLTSFYSIVHTNLSKYHFIFAVMRFSSF